MADINIEVFINTQLDAIQTQASGRSKEHKALRYACHELKELLRSRHDGAQGSRLSVPFPSDVTSALLSTMRSALSFSNHKLSEPALGCLHKLVAYAYLQGETRPSGPLDDADNVVTQVVCLAAKAGEGAPASVQLGVVKALLTLTTAEHFVPHGDCLMHAVRTLFNLAVSGASDDLRNTARSALLQVMNTVVKRVSQQAITPLGTPMMSPAQKGASLTRSTDDEGESARHRSQAPEAATGRHTPGDTNALSEENINREKDPLMANMSVENLSEAGGVYVDQAIRSHLERLPKLRIAQSSSLPLNGEDKIENEGIPIAGIGLEGVDDLTVVAEHQQHLEDSHTARLASLAERADLRGLELALGGLQTDVPVGTAPTGSTPPPAASTGAAVGQMSSSLLVSPGPGYPSGTSSIDSASKPGAQASQPRSPLCRVDTPPDPRRALMRERRAEEWKRLTVSERDAVVVLTAMCKLAARETGAGAGEMYMHTGKLVALDMLVRVLTNPMHDWSSVRREFAAQLRQPMCLTLLRNCASPYEAAVTASTRILVATMFAPRLREGLKSELGALYPLLLLRPLEADRPELPAQATAALEGLATICGSPQVLVDVFVNYDCSLQAANLFERSLKALAKYVRLQSSAGVQLSPLPMALAPKARAIALKALLAAIKSLDTWAGPLKPPPDIWENRVQTKPRDGGDASNSSLARVEHEVFHEDGIPTRSLQQDVLQRIHTDKALKSNLAQGITTFNTVDPVKGLKALVAAGAVGSSDPAALASFLREHAKRLDPAAVGELFGDQREASIAVMHAYIDGERFAGLSLDEALRRLLFGFRLPGEAQKIDRIMEKFAARYCMENPGAFPAADAAYLLAFAIIMLNTDAHNPMADARLSPEDFVSMCTYQTESGEYAPILPEDELVSLYARIVREEITVRQSAFSRNDNSNGIGSASSSSGPKQQRHSVASSSKGSRLAAALGLEALAAPFWPGESWDKQHGADVERRRLLELTGKMLAGYGDAIVGIAKVPMWHAATHAEHARPMFQVCGDALGRALPAALDHSSTLVEAAAVLDGYEQAIRLAALLRLETLCEMLTTGLAAATRVDAPPPPHSSEEARAVAALSRLVSLGSSGEAGALGSAWVVLLRTSSELEVLKASLSTAAAFDSGKSETSTSAAPSRSFFGSRTGASSSAAGQVASVSSPSGGTPSGTPLDSASTASPLSNRIKGRGALSVREAPGMGIVLWAETAGVGPLERLFAGSTGLDGDAVLTFFRALCAVSQEELDPQMRMKMKSTSRGAVSKGRGVGPGSTSGPRTYLLHRLVECACLNVDGRIRMVWHRIWTVVSQHLVSAACSTDMYVAMYAVDALRQLADRLLSRPDHLAGFSAQGDALRPLASVLRGADGAPVRELAAACIAHAVASHSSRLGPHGWRAVIDGLTIAAGDPAPAVVTQALDAMVPVFEALYAGSYTHIPGSTAGATHSSNNTGGGSYLVVNESTSPVTGHAYLAECIGCVLAAVANPSPSVADVAPTALYLFQTLARRLAEKDVDDEMSGVVVKTEVPADRWVTLLSPLAAVARGDARPKEADTAIAVLFQTLQVHAGAIPVAAWSGLIQWVIAPLLAVQGSEAEASERSSNRIAVSLDDGALSNRGGGGVSTRAAILPRRTTSTYLPLPRVLAAQHSPEGVDRVLRHAAAHMPDLWALLHYSSVVHREKERRSVISQLLAPLLALLQSYLESPVEAVATLGIDQLQEFLVTMGPLFGSMEWEQVLRTLGDMVLTALREAQSEAGDEIVVAHRDHAEVVRRNARRALVMMRCVAGVLTSKNGAPDSKAPHGDDSNSRVPYEMQLGLVDVLSGAVDAAVAFNVDWVRRQRLAQVLTDEGPGAGEVAENTSWGATVASQLYHSHVGESQNGDSRVRTTAPVLRLDELSLTDRWDAPLLPGLLRLEVEGGRLLLDVLRHGAAIPEATSSIGSNGSSSDSVSIAERHFRDECRRRLVKTAFEVLHAAVDRLENNNNTSTSRTGGSVSGDHYSDERREGVVVGSAQVEMEDAIRAPLVRGALHALCALPAASWSQGTTGRKGSEVFGLAARLVRSKDLTVRKAVQQVLRVQGATALRLS